MQTNDTQALEIPDSTHDVTSGDINLAFWDGLAGLESLKKHVIESAMRLARAGKLLDLKNKEIGSTKPALKVFLEAECPDISLATAYRLIAIHARVQEITVSGGRLSLPEGLSSVSAIYGELTRPRSVVAAAEPSKEEEEKVLIEKERALIAKVKASFKGFWRIIKNDRPPENWEPEERVSFLVDLAGRERIRRERGWELPPIYIEVEEVK